jgi:hypothetical protein
MAPVKDDVNSFLMGSESVPSASFLTKGTKHEGEILDLKVRQQLDIDTRKPLFWDNGDPKMQVVVTIQTDEFDDEIEDDDGRRRLYVKYKMKDAIADAVRAAKEERPDIEGLEVGGWLSVEFIKQDKPTKRGKSGVKHFEAVYEPPDPNAAVNAYLDGDDPDEDDDEPEPAPKSRRGKAAPATPSRGRGRRAAPEPDDDEGDDEPEPEKPARGRGKAAAAKPAAKPRGRAASSRSKYVDDDGDGDEPF